jgi:hypothetical protein
MSMTSRHIPNSFLSVACFVCAMASVACTNDEPLTSPPGDETTDEERRRVGSLLAEFETVDDREAPRVDVHAQFIDARGVAVDRAFTALDAWSSDGRLDRDACAMPNSNQQLRRGTRRDNDIRLDLLSVGPITVEGPSRRLQLEERRLPALVEAFSGVVYGTSDRQQTTSSFDRLDYAAGAPYTFRAPGDREVGGFDVTLRAPERVRLEAVSGRVGSASGEVRLRRGRDLSIQWNGSGDEQADLFLDLEAGAGPDAPRLKCRLEDDGRFTLPDELLTELADETSRLGMTLRRVESKRVEVPRIEHAEFYLSASDHLTVHLE